MLSPSVDFRREIQLTREPDERQRPEDLPVRREMPPDGADHAEYLRSTRQHFHAPEHGQRQRFPESLT